MANLVRALSQDALDSRYNDLVEAGDLFRRGIKAGEMRTRFHDAAQILPKPTLETPFDKNAVVQLGRAIVNPLSFSQFRPRGMMHTQPSA